jgi:catechol 2,3-dioxygenase
MEKNTATPARPAGAGAQSLYFNPRRLGHVNLWVNDLKASERFYNQVCGLNVEFTEPDLIATFLGTGHTPHDLGMMQTTKGVDRYGRNGLLQLPGSVGLKPGLNHLAWELENEADLVRAWAVMKQDNVPIDMTVDHQVAHSVYMFDPDGNYNEFYCDTVKDWRSVLKGDMELITSHWDPEASEPFTEGRYETNPALRYVESAPIHPQRITHAVLETDKMEAMTDFYTRIAGLKVVRQTGGSVYLKPSLDDYSHALVLVESAEPAFHHVSFELASQDDLEGALTRLRQDDQDITMDIDLPWKRSFMLKDIDGLQSEWYVTRQAEISLDRHGNTPLAASV